jgi:predicted AAA+ superfamily ATPase
MGQQPDAYNWPELDENTACSLCYTSGTTGNPKGALYSHRSTVLHAYAAALPDSMCHLLRIDNAQTLATHALRGAIFESWVVSETLKHRFNQALPADIYFWRDNHGAEVDLVFEHAGKLHAVEIKSGATFATDWVRACQRWQRYAGTIAADPVLVYGGQDSYSVQGVQVRAWHTLGT